MTDQQRVAKIRAIILALNGTPVTDEIMFETLRKIANAVGLEVPR